MRVTNEIKSILKKKRTDACVECEIKSEIKLNYLLSFKFVFYSTGEIVLLKN